MSEEFFEVGRYYTYKPSGETVKLVSIEPEEEYPYTFRWVNKGGDLSSSFTSKSGEEAFIKLPKKPPTLYVVWITGISDNTRYTAATTFDKKEAEEEYQACVRDVRLWKGVELIEYVQKAKD